MGHNSGSGEVQPIVAKKEPIQAARISESREDKSRVSPQSF